MGDWGVYIRRSDIWVVWRMARACVVFKFCLRLRQFRHKNESTTPNPAPDSFIDSQLIQEK